MEKLARYSWILGLLGLFCLVAGIVWTVKVDVDTTAKVLYAVAGVLLVGFALIDRDALVEGASSRQFRFGGGALAMVVVGLCIAVLGYVVASRHDHTWDLTREGKFTISSATISTVEGLQKDVDVYAFFKTDSPEQKKFQDLIEGLEEHSPHLKVHLIDPLRDPLQAQQFTVTSENGTVVLVSGDDRQRLESNFDEASVANALTKLVSGKDHKVCWSTGHGEVDPDDDQEPDGLGAIVLKLEDQNYTVTKTTILTEGIASDCEALVVARPQQDFLPQEREALAAYLASGGHAFLMLEPETVPELSADLERYGVKVGDDVVLEDSRANQVAGLDPSAILMTEDAFSKDSPITSKLHSVVVFGIARSVAAEADAKGVKVTELLHGSEDSWAETSLDPSVPAQKDEGKDRIGNVPVMAQVEIEDPAELHVAAPSSGAGGASGGTTPTATDPAAATPGATDPAAPAPAPAAGAMAAAGSPVLSTDASKGVPADFAPKAGGKLVVAGDADFPSNQLITLGNNQDLFLNTLAWLVDEQSQVGERPEGPAQTLELSVVQSALLFLVSLVLVPGAAIAAAAIVLVRRRFL